jgi:hypothetical protein
MLYFVRTTSGRNKTAHITASSDLDSILFHGQYRTLCGATVAPKRWGITDEIDQYTDLCRRCKQQVEEER